MEKIHSNAAGIDISSESVFLGLGSSASLKVPEEWEKMVNDLAIRAKLQVSEITLSIITGVMQFGNPYKVMVTLYLPTVWNSVDIELIQKSLLFALTSNLKLPPEDIFIMTTLVDSGNVVENGKIVWW